MWVALLMLSLSAHAQEVQQKPWCIAPLSGKFDELLLSMYSGDAEKILIWVDRNFSPKVRNSISDGSADTVVSDTRKALCAYGYMGEPVFDQLRRDFPRRMEEIDRLAIEGGLSGSQAVDVTPESRRRARGQVVAWSGVAALTALSGVALSAHFVEARRYSEEAKLYVLGTGSLTSAEIEQIRQQANRHGAIGIALAGGIWPTAMVAITLRRDF